MVKNVPKMELVNVVDMFGDGDEYTGVNVSGQVIWNANCFVMLRPDGIEVVMGHGMSKVTADDGEGCGIGDCGEVGVKEMVVARELIDSFGR